MATAVAGLLGELALGVFIGLGVSLLFAGVQLAGRLVSYQAGLALGAAFNPMLESSSTAVSQLHYLVAMMIFLAVGGDRALLATLLDSFESVPPLSFRVTEGLAALMVELVGVSFALAIRVGGPATVALLLGFLTLGFISRTVPQLNILTIGFPIKIAIALLAMAMTIMGLEPVLIEGLTTCLSGVREGLGLTPPS